MVVWSIIRGVIVGIFKGGFMDWVSTYPLQGSFGVTVKADPPAS